MTDREYLVHDRPMKAILIFAIPMMLASFFQQIYTLADSIIVGRFIGEGALAAVGASTALVNVFIAVATSNSRMESSHASCSSPPCLCCCPWQDSSSVAA